MHNKKVLIDAIRNLSNPKKTNKNKNYFDISNSQDSDFISAKDGVDTPIYKKVSVKPSPIAGRGLFAEQSIRAGEPIGVSHIRKKFMRGGEEYQAPFPSTTLGYYNHSKEPNVYEVDKGGHIVMVASRDINPGDEITSNYDQNEIEDLEGSSDFKRGGSTRKAKIPNRKSPKSYSRSLEATNRLFAQNPLFKKPESRKNKIFDPNAEYYRNGGITLGTSTSYPSGLGVGNLANYVPSQMANLKIPNSFKLRDIKTPLEIGIGTPLGGANSRLNTYQGFEHPDINTSVFQSSQTPEQIINNNKANFNNWQETTKGAPIDFRVKQSFYGIQQDKNNPLRGFASVQGGYHPQTGFNAGAEGGVNLVLSRNGQANRYFSNRGLIPKQTVFIPQLTMGFGVKQKHKGWDQDTLNQYENLLNQDTQNNTTNSFDYLNEEGKKGHLTGSRANFAIRPQFTVESRPTRNPLTLHGTIGANINMAAGNRSNDDSGGVRSQKSLYGEIGARYPVDKMFDKKSKAKSKIQEVQDREQEYERERPVKPVEQKEPEEQTEWIGEHPRWLQDGGEQDGMNGMMKARLAYANEFGNPAAKRMINIPDNPYEFENGDTGTHYMASMDNYAVPQIQDENGQLMLGDYGPDSREAMRFDSDEDANYFAEHYKDVSPGFIELKLSPKEIEEYAKGGYIVEDISVPELSGYAEGGWPPKGLRKSIKTIEPKSNKITIGNAKDLATNSSAAQAINAVNDRTLQLWNTSEGQKRLQNLINTTPSLQANLFFDSKDMVSDLANTRNINQEIIDYEALMDNIINEQNQVDSYYDQNLMEKNDYFNTTVDLDTKLKKTEEEYAKLLEHAKTKGGAFYDRNENAFVINPQYFNNAALPKVGMHEVIHLPGLKRGVGRTSIDEKLGGLDLKDQLDFDFSNASNNNSFYKHLNRKGNYLGGAKSYYNLNGGFERSPFLAELREDMLQNNIIKHPYQKVNSKMIKDYYTDYLKKEDKYPLRIFDIMTNKPKNFSLLSNTMNELPSFAPYVVGAGAATLLDNPFDAESNSEDGKYAEGGEPCPDGYIRNNSTGECVLEIAPEQTPAEEWYKNWYANRVIQDEEGQKLLNEARPKLLKRTEKFPEVDYDAKGLGNASGMYNPMTGKISLNSSQMTSPFIRDEVLFHEKGHYITSPSMLDPEMDTYKKMKNHPVHKLREYETGLVNQALVPKNKVSKEEGKFYNYISGNYGEEMSKRIMELRRLAGFKPDQEITDDDLKNFYQKAKTKGWTDPNSDAFVPALIDFQRFINSPQDLKMLLNKMAKNESRGIDEYAPQQAQYGGPLPKAKMGWPPKGLKRTSGSYKAPNINFNKTVPKYTPNPIKKTLRDINIESLGTANALATALLPTKVNPMQVLTLGHPIEGVGPFTGSPLNSIPFYGTKLPEDAKNPVAGVAFRKFGDNLDWVKNTGELNPAHGSALRFGKNQISKEGNWSEMGWANEKYPGVFAAGFDSHVPGSNLQINRMDKRNGVVVTEGDNPAISIMDPGVRLHRRLPFSNRYLDINMDKLRNDQFDWRTMGGNAQSLIERYGYTAGYAALLSALGLAAPQDKVDQYINEPIIRSYEEYIEPLINPKEEDGGEVDYELGQEINKATMEKLKKLGYTFQKIK